jgi:hypothetical protein
VQKDTSKLPKNESISPQSQPRLDNNTVAEAVDHLQLASSQSVGQQFQMFKAQEDRSTQSNGFDLESLRLSQDFASSVGVQKLLTTVPVRKPQGQEFIQVHPDEHWRLQTAVLELKEERETYLVDRSLWPELLGEVVPKMLFTAINRQHVLFIWPIRLPGEDGRLDVWNQSALEAADHAMTHWVRVKANMALGAYEVFQANGFSDTPMWPQHTFQEIINIAFKQRFIDSWEHPVLRRLRGEL